MARFNLIERRLDRFTREPLSVRNAAGVIVVARPWSSSAPAC